MSLLPIISGRVVIAVLVKLGYKLVRQRGSHIRLEHTTKKPITVPDHRVLGKGLLRKIIRDAEVSVDEFTKQLKK